MRDTLLHHTQETVKELTELSEKFETNWASEWNLTILSLVLFNFGEKRQAMPVLIHTGPQRRKSLRDFPLRLLVEGSAPKPLWTQNFILWLRGIRSMRRNPVIADLFHRMKYMERRGSGLRKIVSETEKLPGYTEAYKPEFSSTATDFRVILKNVNYNLEGDAHQVIHQVTHQVIELSTVSKQILAFCTTPKSKKELAVFCGFKDLRNFTLKHINPLLESGQLEMTIPDKPKSRNQKYITVRSE